MKTWAKMLGVIAVLVTTAALAANAVFPSGSWRYRMTVEVETPEGLKTGSAVREVTASTNMSGETGIGLFAGGRGEAVAVDLGQRGTLFALLDSNGSYTIVFDVFGGPALGEGWDSVKYYSNLYKTGAKAMLTPKQYPMLVRFRNIDDPKTVERVDPKNLAATFGDGVKLKAITIEMTNDSVNWAMQTRLPWLNEYYGKMFDGQRFNTINATLPLANSLSAGAFSTRRD